MTDTWHKWLDEYEYECHEYQNTFEEDRMYLFYLRLDIIISAGIQSLNPGMICVQP